MAMNRLFASNLTRGFRPALRARCVPSVAIPVQTASLCTTTCAVAPVRAKICMMAPPSVSAAAVATPVAFARVGYAPAIAPIMNVRNFADAPQFLEEDEVTQRILDVLKKFPRIEESKLSADANFTKDLGIDSLDAVEVVMLIEDEFNLQIPDQEAEKIQSIPDAVRYVTTHPTAT